MFVAKNIEHKEKIQSEFYEILSKYIYKYINRVLKMEYDLHKASKTIGFLYQNFQKRLLKISKWSDYHIDKEYSKFLKWSRRKYNYSENELQQMLNDIITLTIQVMIHKPSLYVEKLLEGSLPSLRNFYYKCLKRLTRIFYENPKSTRSITLSQLKAQIDTTINIILPINKIDPVLQIQQEQEPDEPLIKNITYDFNKLELSQSDNSHKSDKSVKSQSSVSKDHILYYISSDNSSEYKKDKNQNYNRDNNDYNRDKNQDNNPDILYNSTDTNTENLKEIYIPKKQKYYHNRYKIDEINEYFFNE